MQHADDRPDESGKHRSLVAEDGREHPARRPDPTPHQDGVHQRRGFLEMDHLRIGLDDPKTAQDVR
jgi:hypothetical protein